MTYQAPIRDIAFALNAAAGLERLAHCAAAVRVLARPPVPPARPHRIPPRGPGSAMVQDTALSLMSTA